MKRSTLFLSLVAAGLVGCGDDKDDTTSTTQTSPAGGLTDLTFTTGPASTGTTDNPTSTSTPTTSMVSNSEGSGGGSSTTFDPNDCGEAVVDIPIVTPNVMLVLDKSGSMVAMPNGYWDHDADDANNDMIADSDPMMMAPATPKITRWQSLHGVVTDIVSTFDNSMNLGMVLFPSKTAISDYSAAACPVNMVPEVKVGPMNGQNILNAIPVASDTTLKGGTPAAKGINAALAELDTIDNGNPEFIILVTDGAANCSEDAPDNTGLFEVYDELLPAAVGDAFTNKMIPTYVVGIAISDVTSPAAKDGNPDNTNAFMRLNELADLGGKPRPGDTKFYDTQNQVELQAALTEISMQILPCTIDLNPVPVYPDYVEVSVNGVDYKNMQVTDCASEDGWQFTDETKSKIELCGKACSDFQMSGKLDAQYRCPNSG
jgi:hypothetical protein